jgi:hypothetical protein
MTQDKEKIASISPFGVPILDSVENITNQRDWTSFVRSVVSSSTEAASKFLPEPPERLPMYRNGEHVIIWGEHVATWARDVYVGDYASQSALDFHGKWGKSQTDRNVTMSLVVAYTGEGE